MVIQRALEVDHYYDPPEEEELAQNCGRLMRGGHESSSTREYCIVEDECE